MNVESRESLYLFVLSQFRERRSLQLLLKWLLASPVWAVQSLKVVVPMKHRGRGSCSPEHYGSGTT
jgi:hypothetical protein